MVYYHSTTIHSVYALTNSSESVIERYHYDPYGKPTVLEPDWSADGDNASDVHNPYLYTGRRNDAETNLYQYRHRYYSWRLGRFISRDPKGYVDGLNLYEYVGGRVVVALDPVGLDYIERRDGRVYYVNEGWFLDDAPIAIGTIQHGVVSFNRTFTQWGLEGGQRSVFLHTGRYAFDKMPYEILKRFSDSGSMGALWRSIREAQEGKIYGDGTQKEDYYQLRATCEECRDEPGKAITDCVHRIMAVAGYTSAAQNMTALGEGAIATSAAGAGGAAVAATNWWNPIGWTLIGVGGAIAIKGGYDGAKSMRISDVARRAAQEYCKCGENR